MSIPSACRFLTRCVFPIPQDANTAFGSGDMAQLGKNVFQNAAPCLRVRHGCVAALQNEAEFDAVDDVRIHPQSEAMLQVGFN